MKLQDRLVPWLQAKAQRGRLGYFVTALVVLLLGTLICFATFWIAYGFIWFAGGRRLDHEMRLWLAGGALGILALADLVHPRAFFEEIQVATPSGRRPMTIYLPGVGMGSTINPLAPETAHAFSAIWADILRMGPRAVRGSLHLFHTALSFASLDVPGCAAILSVLAKRDERVPYDEIAGHVPEGHDLGKILVDLRVLDLVLFLKADPAGLKLRDECQQEIAALRSKKQERL